MLCKPLQFGRRTPKVFLQHNKISEGKTKGEEKYNALAHYSITNKSSGETSCEHGEKVCQGRQTRGHTARIITDLYTTMQRRSSR